MCHWVVFDQTLIHSMRVSNSSVVASMFKLFLDSLLAQNLHFGESTFKVQSLVNLLHENTVIYFTPKADDNFMFSLKCSRVLINCLEFIIIKETPELTKYLNP